MSILEQAGEGLGGFLPRLGGALLLLVVGFILVGLVRRVLRRALHAAGLDDLGERWGVSAVLERVGLDRSAAAVVAGAVRLVLLAVVVFAALSLLGLEFLSASLNAALLFLPQLLVAMVLLLAGVVLGELARRQVDRLAAQMDLPGPLGLLAEVTVLAIFGVTALAQLGVPVGVPLLVVAIVLSGVALTFALAFGLGAQATAREVSARRYVESAYAIGQDISLDDVRGTITAIESTSTVLETSGGDRLRVPNSRLVGSIVRVHG